MCSKLTIYLTLVVTTKTTIRPPMDDFLIQQLSKHGDEPQLIAMYESDYGDDDYYILKEYPQ